MASLLAANKMHVDVGHIHSNFGSLDAMTDEARLTGAEYRSDVRFHPETDDEVGQRLRSILDKKNKRERREKATEERGEGAAAKKRPTP